MDKALSRLVSLAAVAAAMMAAVGCVAGCPGGDDEPAEPMVALHDSARARRVFQPPPGEVRPVPPHVIHEQGVGPYVLGSPLKRILGLLPRGPRVVLLQIDGLFDYSVVRAEGDSLVIGVEQPSGVTFLTVLDKEIARIESGVGVGTQVAALREAMGEELGAPGLVMDPRMLAFQRLPNVRFVLDEGGERVAAVIVRRDDRALGRGPAGGPGGVAPGEPDPTAPARSKTAGKSDSRLDPRAGSTPAGKGERKPARVPAGTQASASHGPPGGYPGAQADVQGPLAPGCEGLAPEPEILQVARLPADGAEPALVAYGCFSGSPEAVVVLGGSRLTLVGGEPGKLRRLGTSAVTGVVHVAAVDIDSDGRHELALIGEIVNERERAVHVELWRVEAGRLVRVGFEDVYRLSSVGAGWVGAKLEHIDFLVEARVGPDTLEVTGLYVQRDERGVAMVAPLVAAQVPVRRKRGALFAAPADQDQIAGSQGAPRAADANTGPSHATAKVTGGLPRASDARTEDAPDSPAAAEH